MNHTEPNTTVAQWKEAIKTSFGMTYYNGYVAEKPQISDLVVFRNPDRHVSGAGAALEVLR